MRRSDRLLGVVFGGFILAAWVTSVILLLKEPIPELLFGGLTIVAVTLIALGSFLKPPLACLHLQVQGEMRLADSPGVFVPSHLLLHRSSLQSYMHVQHIQAFLLIHP